MPVCKNKKGLELMTTKWKDLKLIVLSERSQTKKSLYCMIRLLENTSCSDRKQVNSCWGPARATKRAVGSVTQLMRKRSGVMDKLIILIMVTES